MQDKTKPIAIIGLSCRLPGTATNPESLWKTCAEQRDVWQPFPNSRMEEDAFYHPDPGRNGTSNVRGAHFLKDNPGLFDATFFNITGIEAKAMDPQQRVLLELSYEALENAGIPLTGIMNSDAAVFIGSSCRDYADLLRRDSEKTELFQSTGLAQSMLANRISYFYNLKGPSVTVDTACSSSLVALHLGCNALRAGEAQIAIVGGSNLILSHQPMIDLSMLRFLSSEGRCYTYDQRGDGFGRGEGAACLVLKPFTDAFRDGDTIRGVIRNSGTNQDGRTVGISLPSSEAQVELIEQTYREADLDPAETSLVEAHGTGTPAGDPIEAASLSKTIAQRRPEHMPLMVGSIKSNIGHLEGASGIASVVKAVLMLEKNLILPNFDFRKPNSRIPMREWNIEVPKTVVPWPSEGVHRISVNNFGFGGSNAHVILEDAHGYMSSRDLIGKHQSPVVSTKSEIIAKGSVAREGTEQPRIFLITAVSEVSGLQQAKALGQYLRDHRDHGSDELLGDIAYTLAEHRSKFPLKAAFAANSLSQLADALTNSNSRFQTTPQAEHVAFIFTGQGAQWHGMGRELFACYPVFRKSLESADQYIQDLGACWSLLGEFSRDEADSRITNAFISQPLTTAIQIGLVNLFASWNIKPTRVTGHSSGEIAAAYCAGALTHRAAIAIAYYRGQVALKVRRSRDGAMLAVGLSEEETNSFLMKLRRGRAKVACVNSPSNVTVSGDRSAVSELSAIFQAQGVFVRKLAVDVAYHSHHMKDVADEYCAALAPFSATGECRIDFHSSVHGMCVPASDLDSDYWVSNMVEPVRFSCSVRSLLQHQSPETAIGTLLEIGPHSALQGSLKQILQSFPGKKASHIRYGSALKRNANSIHTCQALAVQLLESGCPIDLSAVNFPYNFQAKKVLVDLPPYSWDHSISYWAETAKASRENYPRSDILGVMAKDSVSTGFRWRNIVRRTEIPWINDHAVQSNTIYPAAGFLSMAIEAECQHKALRRKPIKGYQLREVVIGYAMVLSPDIENVETAVSLRPHNESRLVSSNLWDEFSISSSNDGDTWTEHCRGLIRVEDDGQTNEVDGGRQLREESEQYRSMPSDFENECTTIIDVEEMYEGLGQLGLGFGPTFTNLQIAHASQDKCFAQVSIPNTAAKMPLHFEYSYVIHPATLDSFVQAVFAIGGQYKHRHHGTPVPTFVQELYVSQSIDRSPGHILDVYAQIDPQDVRPHATFSPKGGKKSLIVLDRSRSSYGPEVSIQGLEFSYLALNTQEEGRNNGYKMNYQINWQPDPSFLCWVQAPEISKMFRFPCPDDNQIIASQQTAFYYAERAVSAVSPEEVSTKQPHLQKLYAALVRFCKIIRNKQLGSLQTNDWLQLSSEDRAIVCARVGQSPGGTLLHPVGENLPRILRGEIEPLSVMMEDNRLERYCRTYGPVKQSYKQAAAVIKLLGNKNPQLKILALGASAGGATFSILEALSGGGNAAPNFTKYDFTDPYPTPFENATAMLSRWSSLITFRKLDIECDPIQQGYRPSSYDLIVAANEVHTIGWTENALKNVRSLLKPGGTLILIEITLETIVASLTFGTLPGWWSGQSWSHTRKNIPPSQPQTAEEPNPVSGPLLSDAQWDSLLHATGFTGENAVLWDTPDVASHQISTFIATLPLKHREAIPAVTIVLNTDRFEPCASQLRSLLSKEGIKCNLANLPECAPKDRISIVLYELTGSVLRNPSPSNFEGIKRIFLDSSGVLWVTEGGLIECSNPDLNLVIGIARTIRAEKGDTMITTLDLDAQNPLSPAARAAKIFSVFTANFRKEVATSDIELEYAERNGVVMIPRLVEDNRFSSPETSAIGSTSLGSQPFNRDGRPLRAEIGTPGLLDSIQFVADDRISGELSENDVEVNIKASGINFRDVMTALGQISSYPLGCECSGIVSAVGKSVHDFQLGDRVIATVKDGCFCSSVRTTAYAVEKIPDDIPFEVAATFPISYFTAYWATFKVARLRKDETILVHAGSGGVGQALINLSQLIGAKVFATVGNLEKKRLLVDRYHIPDCNIFSSRDSTFAKGIMRATKGRGVDVIMNSLSGDALRLTWNCIAPFGRFVELGKRDFTVNSHLEMRCFEKNVSFTGLDVPLDSHHAEKRKIWAKIMRLHRNGSIKAPWPITVFGISEVEKALRIMQSGKHMGKIVLMPQPGEMVKVVRSKMNDRILRDDVSYLLVGGLGGIGRATARWMFQHGAKNFIFASRSGSDKEASQETISVLRNKGAQVAVFKCDISNLDDLKRVLRESRENMPPIRGLIHGTFVLKVNLFEKMSLQDYNDVMRPKVDGIWHLHNQLSKVDLDFFIMLSSSVGLIGDPSQAAYVSASVFQDAFADFRRNLGLPAVTLDLGKVANIGILAEEPAARRGARALWGRDLQEDEVMAMIKWAIVHSWDVQGPNSTVIGLKNWSQAADPVFQAPIFARFRRIGAESSREDGQEVRTALPIRISLNKAKSPEEAAQKVLDELLPKVSSLLIISVEEIKLAKSLLECGMDSLVAVELRNWLIREFEATLPIMELMENIPLQRLSFKIARRSKLVNPAIFDGAD